MSAPTPLVDLAYRIRTNQDLADRAAERARIATADRERAFETATARDFKASDEAGYIDHPYRTQGGNQ